MKKIMFISLFLSLFLSPNIFEVKASLSYRTCGDMYQNFLEYRKMQNGLDFDSGRVGHYMGYLIAHAEALSFLQELTVGGNGFPDDSTIGQLSLIYGEYLEENPQIHHRPGMECFFSALRGAFPNYFKG